MNLLTEINLRFPIGEAPSIKKPSSVQLNEWIHNIENFPVLLKEITKELTVEQLNWKYRPNGWTIKQVIHHCSDSHMNSYIRFKLALTEETPKIRPYFEDKWAELTDSLDNDISDSIELITVLHRKWVKTLKTLTKEELQKEFAHPEHGTIFNLAENIGIYSWHSMHHLEHIKLAIKSEGNH